MLIASKPYTKEKVNLLRRARTAARLHQNNRAVLLYQQYIESYPSDRKKILGDYAIQLTYSGESEQAIPLFIEFLRTKPPNKQRNKALLGLALAYRWTGKPEKATVVYEKLLRHSSDRKTVLEESSYALIDQARQAAYENQHEKSIQFYQRVLNLNPDKDDEILREYADQLTYGGQAAKAIPFYLELLREETDNEERVKLRLALALAYRRNHEFEKAKELYRFTLGDKVYNQEATHNLLESQIDLARFYAYSNRNLDSALLFEEIIKANPQRRNELLREYADQLTYAGYAKTAIPLYEEYLNNSPDEKNEIQARLGLGLALRWAKEWKKSHQEYSSLYKEFPKDSEIKNSWIDNLLEQGKHATRSGKNEELYFQKLAALAPNRRYEFLIEWADQLTYNGKPLEAIPLYEELLQQELTEAKEIETKLGLALALQWSEQFEQANALLEQLEQRYPTHKKIKESWINSLVEEARYAAHNDLNKRSSQIFDKIIHGLAPERRGELLKEYADQLNYTDRSKEAIPLYQEALELAKDEEKKIEILEGLALAFSWSGDINQALNQYQAILESLENNLEALQNQKGILLDAARLLANENQNKLSAQIYGNLISLYPDSRSALLKEYADQLTYSGEAKKAIPLYEEYLALKPSKEQAQAAILNLALALHWSSENGRSLYLYNQLLADNPNNISALIGKGNVLLVVDQLIEAKKAYTRVLNIDPYNPEAARKYGRALSFQNKQRDAQRILRRVLADHPDDAEAAFFLAQAQFWMGRPNQALESLDLLFAHHPDYFDGRALEREIIHFGKPRTDTGATDSHQSDKLVIKNGWVYQSFSPDNNQTRFAARYHRFQYAPKAFGEEKITLDRPGLFARHRFSDALEWHAILTPEYSHSKIQFKRHEVLLYDTWLTYWADDVYRADIGTSRTTFDNIRSLVTNTWANYANVSLDITPDNRSRLTVRGNYGVYTDTNRRLWGMIEGEFRVFKIPRINVGFRNILYTFRKLLIPFPGYFNPKMYRSHAGFAHMFGKFWDKFYYDIYGSFGIEHARPFGSKRIFDAGASLTYQATPQLEIKPYYAYFSSGESTGFARSTAGISINWIWDPGYKQLTKPLEPQILDGPIPLLDYVRRTEGDDRTISPIPGSSLGDR